MKLKRRILSGALALAMVAGSFFINSGKASAEDPAVWVPSQADIEFAATALAAEPNWAFDVTSVGLHNAILVKYPTIDNAPHDGYISKTEAGIMTGTLDVTGRAIQGTMNGVENFTHINTLYLFNNKLTGQIPNTIGKMTALNHFAAYSNQLSGIIPAEIGQMTGLVTLKLQVNKLTGSIPSEIGNLTLLDTLFLGNNPGLEGVIPSELYTLPNLKSLFLTATKLSGNPSTGFPASSKLNALYIDNTNLIQARPNIPTMQVANGGIFVYDNLAANLLNGTKDNLNGDITQADITHAIESANYWAEPDKSTWLANIAIAQAMLDAKTDVEALFKTDETTLADGITEEMISDAQDLVDLVEPGELQDELQAKINLATQMLEAKNATDTLLTIAPDNTNLANGITQTDITAAQDLVTALDDITAGDLKAELQAKIDTAQSLLDGAKLVSDLFTDGTKIALATSVTQGAITAAKTAVEALPTGDTQDALLADVATAQSLLDAKTLADAKDVANADLDQKATDAKTAIDNLPNLTDAEKTAAKDAVDNALTDAKDAVELATTPEDVVTEKDSGVTKINDEVTKAAALDVLNAAKAAAKSELDQKATDAKNAITALPNLTDSEKAAEINKVEADLSDAKTAIDSATDATAVNNAKNSGDTNITNDLNDAKALDAANLADAKTAAKAELVAKATAVKDAIDALTGLSTAEKNTAKDAINAELTRGSNAIDAATTLTKVTEEKTTSIDNMDNILAKAQKVSDAKNTVNDLFDNTGKIKDNVNQDIINIAKEKVNGLDPGDEKDQLLAKIDDAENQLVAKNQVNPTPVKPIDSGSSTKTYDNVNTGDHSNIIFYVVGMLLALIGLGFVIRRKMIKQS